MDIYDDFFDDDDPDSGAEEEQAIMHTYHIHTHTHIIYVYMSVFINHVICAPYDHAICAPYDRCIFLALLRSLCPPLLFPCLLENTRDGGGSKGSKPSTGLHAKGATTKLPPPLGH
jgi:hypothetical protein